MASNRTCDISVSNQLQVRPSCGTDINLLINDPVPVFGLKKHSAARVETSPEEPQDIHLQSLHVEQRDADVFFPVVVCSPNATE